MAARSDVSARESILEHDAYVLIGGRDHFAEQDRKQARRTGEKGAA
jgi:hypothetical protein